MVAGNHDGNESEKTDDLAAHLDNTFTPSGFGQRWFHFSIAGLAEFFALDSTRNQPSGVPAPVYTAAGEQTQWLTAELAKPALPWRFAIQHHPMFTAGLATNTTSNSPSNPPPLSKCSWSSPAPVANSAPAKSRKTWPNATWPLGLPNADSMKITPVSDSPLRLTNANGLAVTIPFVITKSKLP